MRFFAFQIKKPAEDATGEVVAFAACWIDSDDKGDAGLRARTMIADQGWQIDATLEDHVVSQLSYPPGDENLRYYEQAQLDGEVLVIYLAK